MFSNSAQFYDVVYSDKDYSGEVLRLQAFIAEHKRSAGNTLLDVGCGTGGHIPYLRDDFVCEGPDLDPELLAIARERHPGIVFHEGDMVDFDLGRQFDVVTSLFSAIAYVREAPKLDQAIATLARHVLPGGVLVVEPFFSPDAWMLGLPHAMFVDQPDLKIARMNVSGRRDDIALLDFHYLVATPDGIERFTEHHELGLFSDAQYRHAFAAAGLDVASDAEGLIGRGIYISSRPFA